MKASSGSVVSRQSNSSSFMPPARLLKQNAIGRAILDRVGAAEQRLIQYLHQRMEQVEHSAQVSAESASVPLIPRSPEAHLRDLSDRCVLQTPDGAYRDLLASLVYQLVPDELRLLALLSDERRAPVVHLDATTWLGGCVYRELRFLSRLGTQAGLCLSDRTSYYLDHLCRLQLLTPHREDSDATQSYETIENCSEARQAAERIAGESGVSPKFIRETVQLSTLGQEVWRLSQPSEDGA